MCSVIMAFENSYDVPEDELDNLYIVCTACGNKLQGALTDVAFVFDDEATFEYRETKYVYWFLTNQHLLGFATCDTEECCSQRAKELNDSWHYRLTRSNLLVEQNKLLAAAHKNEIAEINERFEETLKKLAEKNILSNVAHRRNAELCERILVEGLMEREGLKVVEPSEGRPPELKALPVSQCSQVLELCEGDAKSQIRVYKPTYKKGMGADLVIFTSKSGDDSDTTTIAFVQVKLGSNTVQGGDKGDRSAGKITKKMTEVVDVYMAAIDNQKHKCAFQKVLWASVVNASAKEALETVDFLVPASLPWPERLRQYVDEINWLNMEKKVEPQE